MAQHDNDSCCKKHATKKQKKKQMTNSSMDPSNMWDHGGEDSYACEDKWSEGSAIGFE